MGHHIFEKIKSFKLKSAIEAVKPYFRLNKLSDKQLDIVMKTTTVLALTSIPPIVGYAGVALAMGFGVKAAALTFLPYWLVKFGLAGSIFMSVKSMFMLAGWKILHGRAAKIKKQRKASANGNKTVAATTPDPSSQLAAAGGMSPSFNEQAVALPVQSAVTPPHPSVTTHASGPTL